MVETRSGAVSMCSDQGALQDRPIPQRIKTCESLTLTARKRNLSRPRERSLKSL